MSDQNVNDQNIPMITKAGTIVAVVGAIVFIGLEIAGVNRHIFGAVMLVSWLAVLVAARPLVAKEAQSALWFAMALLFFFLLFVYETFAYTGKVRTFPLLIGFMGIVFSVLDVLSLTRGGAGVFVTRMFGQAFDAKNLEGRSARREVIVIVSMCLIVAAIYILGFLAACLLVVIAWMRIAGGKSWQATIWTALGSLVFVYGLFEVVLQYELYRGVIFEWYRS